ncbi:MAG: ribosome maturation factor RimP [Lachnospiraceae bacterium]|nr:ribosome maturation factor RimP [Lachnospiraceae bacterium]
MSGKKDYEEKTEKLIMPILEEQGFELVDLSFEKEAGNYYLRAYIDKPGGIMLNDCELVNRALSDKLDEDDFIEESYILEVSSPGLTRPLKKEKDFERSIGSLVDVHLYKPVSMDMGGKKPVKTKLLTGILKSYDTESIVVDVDDNELKILRDDISLVKLAVDF